MPFSGGENVAWSGNTHKHVSRTTRRRILARDGHACQSCGSATAQLEVDHIDNTRGANYDADENLQTLCVACHQRKTQAESYAGLMRRIARRQLPVKPHPGLY